MTMNVMKCWVEKRNPTYKNRVKHIVPFGEAASTHLASQGSQEQNEAGCVGG